MMNKAKIVFFLALVSFLYSTKVIPNESDYCDEYLEYVLSSAKDKYLSSSVERVHKKLELAFLTAFAQKKKLNLKTDKEFIRLTEALKEIDPGFNHYLKRNINYQLGKLKVKKEGQQYTLEELLIRWKEYEELHPEIFQDLKTNEKLDNWDIFTAKSINALQKLDLEKNPNYRGIIKNFNHPETLTSKDLKFKDAYQKAKEEFQKNEKIFEENLEEITKDSSNKYQNACAEKEETISCLLNKTEEPINSKALLKEIEAILTKIDSGKKEPIKKVIASLPLEPDPIPVIEDKDISLEDLDILKPNYKKNEKIATYCERDPNVANTILIHHTATSNKNTAVDINQMHLQRTTGREHWYMVGYNYLIKQDSYTEEANIDYFEGRPLNMSGSHAGGYLSVDKETSDLLKTENISCGNMYQGFKTSKIKDKLVNGKINGNITTIGITIIGNYSPKKYVKRGRVTVIENETGYDPKGPKRYPSEKILKKTAQLACALQKKYPRLKTLKPHKFVHDTDCPGNVEEKLKDISQYAKEYSCDFSL